MIGKNLKKITLQLLLKFFMLKNKKIYPGYVSKHKSSHGKQVIILMVPNSERDHYVTVKTCIIKKNNV